MQTKSLFVSAILMRVFGAVALSSTPVYAQISGAIFTTDSACDATNLNIYMNKQQVFLGGGPGMEGAAGLPDGEYYVKVTEPNGALLGTSIGAADETPVVVVNGEFVECYGLCDILVRAGDGQGNGCGYDTTSNPGGEYKAWVSQDANFANSLSKTDNFKVADGVMGERDGCPNDPTKTVPGICGCGVADTDTDGDGTPDCFDACPDDRDTDGDGVDDCLDNCPNDPNKLDPGICGCGVADSLDDGDGDGMPDCLEQPPAGQPMDDCGCGSGMDGLMFMPVMLLGTGGMRRRSRLRLRRK